MNSENEAVIGVFAHHADAEDAIRRLANANFDMTKLSIIGKGYHSEERVVGFYSAGDRIRLWGKNGAFWGGLWGLFVGGLFLTVPVVGHLVVLGHLASMVVAAAEGAVIAGGLSALGAALVSLGIPKNSILRYEQDLRADKFLVVVHGTADEVKKARTLMTDSNPVRIETHALTPPASTTHENHSL